MKFRVAGSTLLGVLLMVSSVTVSSCVSPIATLQNEIHPENSVNKVKATLEPRSGGTYAAVVTIHNNSRQILHLQPTMFRLEGTPPTQFTPTTRDLIFRPGFNMPPSVGPDAVAQGEIKFSLRGTPQPVGPVALIVALPDGEHSFTFEVF